MKFTTKVKPVKIRIISGGEEHSSIETLKKNFDFGEVMNLIQDHRMSTWLRRQHQDAMAQHVEELIVSGPLSIKDTTEYFVRLYKIFFSEGTASSISDIIQNWKINDVYQKNLELLNRQLKSQNDTLLVIDNILRGIRIKNAEVQQEDREQFRESSDYLVNTIRKQFSNGYWNLRRLKRLKKLYEDYFVDYYLLQNDSDCQSCFNDVLDNIRKIRHIPSFQILQDIISSSKNDASFSIFLIKETSELNEYFSARKNQISQENTRKEFDIQMKDFDAKCDDVDYLELIYYFACTLDDQAISDIIQNSISKNIETISRIDRNIIESHTDLFDFMLSLCPSIKVDETKEFINSLLNDYEENSYGTFLAVKKVYETINDKDSELNYDEGVLRLILHLLIIRYFIVSKENTSQDNDVLKILNMTNGSVLSKYMRSTDDYTCLQGTFEILNAKFKKSDEGNKLGDLIDDLLTIFDPKKEIEGLKTLTSKKDGWKFTISPLNNNNSFQFVATYNGRCLSRLSMRYFLKYILDNLYTILESNE